MSRRFATFGRRAAHPGYKRIIDSRIGVVAGKRRPSAIAADLPAASAS
jgi:hypothetical protein